ncbi:MAG: hypothetical protein WCW47_03425 [Candidatus Paceibacterota bacterium]|jgi:tetratricopeptide (TPR) repeat protein
MQLTKNHKIIISTAIVIILLGIYITFDKKSKQITENKIVGTTTATTTNNTETGIKGNYKIEQVPITESKEVPQPIPDLNREPVLYSGAIISPEAKTLAVEKIKSLQTTLKNNPANLFAWIDLGIYQKQAGDYSGAVLSWKYAVKLSPADYVSPANLGNLYAYFLKDNTQAEIYYKQAISKGSTQAYLYTQLAEIYRDIFKDLNKARIIVNQGLSKIPNDPNLLQLQTSLQ